MTINLLCHIYIIKMVDLNNSRNLDMIYQNIPGTFNWYDREIIHKEMNLKLPPKIGINNWSDEVRGKSFVSFPPRPRIAMMETADEMAMKRQQEFGIKVDPGSTIDNMIGKVGEREIKIKKFNALGQMVNENGDVVVDPLLQDDEMIKFSEIIFGQLNPLNMARIGNLMEKFSGLQNERRDEMGKIMFQMTIMKSLDSNIKKATHRNNVGGLAPRNISVRSSVLLQNMTKNLVTINNIGEAVGYGNFNDIILDFQKHINVFQFIAQNRFDSFYRRGTQHNNNIADGINRGFFV